jgi:hypothetical protein
MKKMKFVEVGGFGMYVKDKPNAIDGAFVGMSLAFIIALIAKVAFF